MTPTDSRDLTRVGPGTPMGAYMRRYWMPAAKSTEIVRDGPPLRLMLLGERLIAFRDTSGRVGVMDHRCPHRCASLFLGINDADGIRCAYHGWKFDVNGKCLDMPSDPTNVGFREKVRAKAYRTIERGGIVWVYMGEGEPPAFPMLEAAMVPDAELRVVFALRECNWLQAIEGDLDTSHFGLLHLGHLSPGDLAADNPLRNTIVDRAPKFIVNETDWGVMAGAHRPTEDGKTYWRFSHYVAPFWALSPQGDIHENIEARAWVPVDDHHTMFVWLFWTGRTRPPIIAQKADGSPLPGMDFQFRFLPNTTDWLGRWRLAQSARNDWGIDRVLQKHGTSYSGIAHIHMQDQAITESMGPIADHSMEHLGRSDLMILRTRRLLLSIIRGHTKPPGVSDPSVFFGARGGYATAEPDVTGDTLYRECMAKAVRLGQKAG